MERNPHSIVRLNSIRSFLFDQFSWDAIAAGMLIATGMLVAAAPASAQVRGKLPDRGVYQSPKLQSVELEELGSQPAVPRVQNEDDLPIQESRGLQQVGHNEVVLIEPPTNIIGSGAASYDEVYHDIGGYDNAMYHDATCDGCGMCDGSCDSGCDAGGCDGCGGSCFGGCSNASICFSRDQWFGGLELLVMFRKGDFLPPLVTTGPSTNVATAGSIGAAGTRVLAGNESQYKDGTIGGRATLGTWLDESQCRSLVFRGWIAAEDSFSFNGDQSSNAVLTRPFFDVSTTPNEQSTVVVAFPGAASGSINVGGSSNVFGGDISVRQLLYGKYGGTVDVLYGYQYMRLNEDLQVSSNSLSLDGSLGPVGSVISIADSIDATNDFHGGQLGIASRYREGCWSFQSLAKAGFGSLRRTAKRSGVTVTENGADRFTDPNGLLVRSTNDGTVTDNTFGWVPELDFTLGWHRYPRFDVTFGYHIIAMTDALQVSGAIDPNLASNLTTPLVGAANPSPALRYDTFYVQGIHFGLQYVY